jgi:hypothetical protein
MSRVTVAVVIVVFVAACALASSGCAVIDVVMDPTRRGCWSTNAPADDD